MEKLNNRIKELLELLESGNSTLEQEAELKHLLISSKNLPKEFSYAKLYFIGMSEASLIKYPNTIKRTSPNRGWRIGLWSMSTAAVITLIVSIIIDKNKDTVYATVNGTPITDKQVAEMIVINSIQDIEELITTPLQEIEDVLNLLK
jgi:hypothetical protein